MAKPIAFVPKSTNPQFELQHQVSAAPRQHAEAILAAYDLLDEAHRQGILDALQGAIGARDTIAGTIANYAAQPEGINAMRNLLALGKLLGTLDPEPLSRFSKEAYTALETNDIEQESPTLWQLFKRLRHPETRRGLSVVMAMLGAVGRASRRQSSPAM
jgi:uncharacterized protein YjgD (DUF1641 family)